MRRRLLALVFCWGCAGVIEPQQHSLTLRFLDPPSLPDRPSTGHGMGLLVSEVMGRDTLYALVDATDDSLWLPQRLAALGVSRLQFVILTHPHQDHFNGALRLPGRIPVRAVYENGMRAGNPSLYGGLVDSFVAHAAGRIVPSGLTQMQLFPGSALWSVAPGIAFSPSPTPGVVPINGSGLVVRIELGGYAAVIMADQTAPVSGLDAQGYMLAAWPALFGTAQILHLPHHGLIDAFDTRLYAAVRPSYALVSNANGTNLEALVLQHLTGIGVVPYCNRSSGEVTMILEPGAGWRVTSEKVSAC